MIIEAFRNRVWHVDVSFNTKKNAHTQTAFAYDRDIIDIVCHKHMMNYLFLINPQHSPFHSNESPKHIYAIKKTDTPHNTITEH